MSLAELKDYEFAAPKSLSEACEILARCERDHRSAHPLAGCTDWMVARHAGPFAQLAPGTLAIDITRLPELRGIEKRGGTMKIGAAETFASVRRSSIVNERCPLLAQMACEVGAVQIQARATLGGNLVTGSPAADGVVAMFAYETSVVLASVRGERAVPIDRFYTGYRTSVRKPDELVVRFEFPTPARGSHQLWRKVGTRNAQAISKAAVAAHCELDRSGVVTRVGFGAGAVAPTVRALGSAAALVRGRRATEVDLDALECAVDGDIAPMDDIRSTARYRRHLVRTLIRRFFEPLCAR